MRNMGDYRDLYLNNDDLLLVNVFDESKNMCLQYMQCPRIRIENENNISVGGVKKILASLSN